MDKMLELSEFLQKSQNPVVEDYMCRICLEDGERKDFIAPCSCSGTSKWVHRHCLDRWRSIREDIAFSECTECHTHYEIECITPPDELSNTWVRRLKFCCLVSRDFGLMLAVSTLFIMAVAVLVMCFDLGLHHYLLKILHMQHHPAIGYLTLSLTLILAYVGMHFACIYLKFCSPPNFQNSSIIGGNCRCCDDIMFMPYYVTPDLQPSCCGLEYSHCSSREVCGNATAVGTTAGDGSIATSSCSCCECGGAELGHEVAVVLFVLLVLFAIVGVVIAVFVGSMVLQSILSKHIHVLGKWNLTKEYKVKDLASDGGYLDNQENDNIPPLFFHSIHRGWNNTSNNSPAVRRSTHHTYQSVGSVNPLDII